MQVTCTSTGNHGVFDAEECIKQRIELDRNDAIIAFLCPVCLKRGRILKDG